MSKPVKSKLCWNCEGTVSLVEETCPYCGVSVIPATLDGTYDGFAPPYRSSGSQEEMSHESPYDLREEEGKPSVVEEVAVAEVPGDEAKRAIFAVVALLAGSVFFLFGLVLVLFSQHGVFTLQWNANYWYFYLAFSLPLLILGWRVLSKLDP